MRRMNLFLSAIFALLQCSCSLLSADANPFYFIDRYGKLTYDKQEIDGVHRRIRRSANSNDAVFLKFRSHGRDFHLRLKRDTSVFSPTHIADQNGKAVENDLSFLYQGTDLNDPSSYVYGSLIDGVFDGHIIFKNDSFYIEKTSRYFKHHPHPQSHDHHTYHSIIYSENDINYDRIRIKRNSDDQTHPGCGLNGAVSQWMQRIQRSAVFTNDDEPTSRQTRRSNNNNDNENYAEREAPWRKYSAEAQRQRRSNRAALPIIDSNGWYAVRTCTLYMQADQKLWEYIFNHEGQRSNERTREEIFALFNNHIKAVNAIYEVTDFGGIRGINFNIQRTTIWDNTSCPNSELEDSKKNPFCDDNVDVSNYLNLNSIKNQSDFCLAYALTYRDFVGGTLGLAWVASPQPSTSGGICEVYKPYSEGGKRVKRSLNTGIITLVNYHNRVPTKVSQLTLAHEIGHNFGSPHDYPSYCQPGLPDGNFIMFASATSGDKPNNSKFSPCSIANISAVLKEVLSQPPALDNVGAKRNCLIDPTTSFCGNGVVEEGEECDCGFNEDECKQRQDTCCYPKLTAEVPNPNACKRINNVDCSPTEGPCCSRECKFKPVNGDVCRQASDCSVESRCDGRQAACPPSKPKPDRTLCQENTKICNAGNCNRSICELVDMDECFITTGTPEDQCQLACKVKTSDTTSAQCLASTNIGTLKQYYVNRSATASIAGSQIGRGILLRPGSPCNDYKGYCDIFQKCRSVDSNGPLSRLKNLLFNSETLQSVRDWVQVYWWAVVLMAIGLVLFMALFIKCCAVHTPSTNPRKPPAQSIYETLRRPTTLLRSQPNRGGGGGGQRHHQHRSRSNHRRRSAGNRDAGDPTALNGPTSSSPTHQVPASAAVGSASAAPVEPPPPYTERAPPAVYGGSAPSANAQGSGPPRGHRKRKHRDNNNAAGNPSNRAAADLVEMRGKRV